MKNRQQCPKCDNTDILTIAGSTGPFGVGNNIMVGLTIFSAVTVSRYVCKSCGYSEEWISKEDIPKLMEKYGDS